jgi:cupin fold WbuC family metalloprotein
VNETILLMGMKVFSHGFLDELSSEARSNERLRINRNIHRSHSEPCQRLLNAIEPGSYIQPHRHAGDERDELLVAVRGSLALLLFDDFGAPIRVVRFGNPTPDGESAIGVEIPYSVWHTVVSLSPGSVLLEVKAGPFDPAQAKELAPWAPAETSPDAKVYLRALLEEVDRG